jgi:hypothetical protein
MKIEEIVRQSFIVAKSKLKENHEPLVYENEYSMTGFGLRDSYNIEQETPVKIYKHKLFSTKGYSDAGCAAFKLCKGLESLSGGSVAFWRMTPYVKKNIDFMSGKISYVGLVRFSCEEN